MHNDSIETLLLRHYGNTAPTPPALEQRLLTSLRREAVSTRRKQQVTQRLNRRRAVQLVALGSASVGLLGLGLDGLNTLGSTLMGADSAQPILP